MFEMLNILFNFEMVNFIDSTYSDVWLVLLVIVIGFCIIVMTLCIAFLQWAMNSPYKMWFWGWEMWTSCKHSTSDDIISNSFSRSGSWAYKLCVFNVHKSKCGVDCGHAGSMSRCQDAFDCKRSISIFIYFFTRKCLGLRGFTRNKFSIVFVCDNVAYVILCCRIVVGSKANVFIVKPCDLWIVHARVSYMRNYFLIFIFLLVDIFWISLEMCKIGIQSFWIEGL